MIKDAAGNVLYLDGLDIQKIFEMERQIKELKALIVNN